LNVIVVAQAVRVIGCDVLFRGREIAPVEALQQSLLERLHRRDFAWLR